jgi:hypothetical protein
VIDRRKFLAAAALSSLPAIAVASPARGDGRTPRPSSGVLPAVLIDARFAQARAVGTRLADLGATVHAMPDGDITPVWLSHIRPAWKAQPVTIVGLTARPALFCLEQFAFACSLRVVFHAEHLVHREGRTEHRVLRGAQAAGISARDLALAGWLWPAHIAQAMAMHRHKTGGERYGPSDAALSPTLPPRSQLLTSWIIAAA